MTRQKPSISRSPLLLIALAILVLLTACAPPAPQVPANIIFFIGDGMGSEQLAAASLYETGVEDGLFIHGLPVESSMATRRRDRAVSRCLTSSSRPATR